MEKLAYTAGVRCALRKLALYTQWSKEPPQLRQLGTEDQGAGLQGGAPHTTVEPASTESESAKATPGLLEQFRPGIDSAGNRSRAGAFGRLG